NQSIYLVGVDVNPLSPGFSLVDKSYVIPPFNKPELYFQKIHAIIQQEQIDVVIPIFSQEIRLFSKRKNEFEQFTGIRLCIPEFEIMEITDDKYNFYLELKKRNLPTPETFVLSKRANSKFPCVIKKRRDSGSRSFTRIDNATELSHFIQSSGISVADEESYVIQEFVEGQEYTIDFCCDFNSRFLGAVIRERLEVRDGKCTKGITIKNKTIRELLKKFLEQIGYIGPGNLQGILDKNNKFHIIEFNPRFAAGGLPLTIHVGFNIPYIVCKLIKNSEEIIPEFIDYPDGMVMLRYFTETFMMHPSKTS
ncbi:MAG: ATP-grasp domain-containing protein, partial [Promethearchaeota archaeon]